MTDWKEYSAQEHLAEMTASRDEWRAQAKEAKRLLVDQAKLTNESMELMREAVTFANVIEFRGRTVWFAFGAVMGFVSAWWIWGGVR